MKEKIAPKIKSNIHSKEVNTSPKIMLGKYEHYKGNMYEVVGMVLHTETNEELVLYKALYDLDKLNKKFDFPVLFARPYNMFFENVVVNGKEVPRFRFVGGNINFRVPHAI